MRTFCPSEEILGEFVAGCLPKEERPEVEEHLIECKKCRELVFEAHQAISKPDLFEFKVKALGAIKKDFWLVVGVLFFVISFIFSGYFFQFLLASLIAAVKWIADTRSSKTVIMIHEARKTPEEPPAQTFFQRSNILKKSERN